jgi:hypothetical protein
MSSKDHSRIAVDALTEALVKAELKRLAAESRWRVSPGTLTGSAIATHLLAASGFNVATPLSKLHRRES